MTAAVLDASALLALLHGERGGERVKAVLGDAVMSVVNLAEVIGHFAKLGASRSEIQAVLQPLPLRLAAVDAELSYDAAMLRPLTIAQGLSLGDRYCLALAKREGSPAFTADRRWSEIKEDVSVEVELIR